LAGIDDILGRIQNAWTGFSFSQKVVIGGIVVAVVASIVVFSLWLRKPSYAVLFSDLDISSAGEVSQELEKMGEKYKVTRGGTTILVPSERVAELRINLASSGAITSGTVGYEIFDHNDIGVTDFVQKLNLKRALEGELSRTISSLTSVEKARVHIVFPKESIFKENSRDATASIVVMMKRGYTLSQSQIRGITNLVAYSVQDLKPENVTVVDRNGNLLSSPAQDDALGLSSTQLDIKRKLESYLAGKAEEMLSRVLGPGKAIVRVNADLDFRNMEVTKESYDPNTVVRSEQTSEESNNQEGSKSENTITNYDINKTVERIVGGGGGIKSLSVAVFVDGRYEDGEGKGKYVPLAGDELKELEDVVKSAVGFDPSRKDVIKVVNLPFYNGQIPENEFKTPMMQWLPGMLTKLGALMIVFFIFLLFKKNVTKLFSSSGSYRTFSRPGPTGRPSAGAMMPGQMSMEPTIEDRTKMISSQDPEQVVKLVKTWMAED